MMKRDSAIDIAKGIAATLVLLGHIPQTPSVLKVWLYSFHMPLFFILSGYVFSTEKYPYFTSFLKRKVKTLLLPYFMLNCLLFLSATVFHGFKNIFASLPFFYDLDFLYFIKGLFLSHRLHGPYYALWFINVLFLSELILYFIQKHLIRKTCFYAAASFVFICLQPVVFRFTNGMYWSIDLLPSALSFLCFGLFLKQHFPRIKTANALVFVAVCSASINLSLGYLNYTKHGMTDLFHCNTGNIILFFLAAISGSLFIIVTSKLIKRNALLEYAGKNTIVYYTFNSVLIIPLVEALFSPLFSSAIPDSTFLRFLTVFIVSWPLLALISAFINSFLPFAAGKPLHAKNSLSEPS